MGNRYYGDFRSIDTSVDPNGQRYRAVIFTGYDGGDPYQREAIIIERGEYDQFIGYMPINNHSITMADNPFTVSYEGDNENIYKPYRCSTATVSFRQSNINLNFLNTNGTSTLVLLLKWNNDVVNDGNRMRNTATGQTITKKNVAYGDFVYFNGYYPWEYDAFCYNVEWVGYSTPETFSMDYSHVTDTFTLNAQDAFSTLQYKKYDWIGNEENTVVSFADTFFDFLQKLGTYRKIYVTDTIKFPDVANNVLSLIYSQQNNNFDEDKKPTDKLQTLTQILTYLNLTAIPFKNNLILTTPNAITEGWSNYYVYALPYNGYVINWPSQGAEYTYTGQEYLSDDYTIDATSFANGGTTISTCNMYGVVTAKVDNYDVGDLMPDIDDKDTFVADDNALVNYYSEEVTEGGETTTNYYCWERKNVAIPANGKITLKHYKKDLFGGGWSNEEEQNPSMSDYTKPGCFLIEHSGFQQTQTPNTLPLNSNYGRDFYFYAARMVNGGVVGTRADNMHNKNNHWQPMLVFESENIPMFAGDNLNICGSWIFYRQKDNKTTLPPYTFEAKDAKSRAHTGQLNTLYNYVWGKVRVGDKWLTNDGETYTWQSNETFVKLYIDWFEGKLAYSTDYDFKQTNRNIKGSCVPLPITGNNVMFGNVHIELDRPIGTYYYCCTSALLQDFEVKIITVDGTYNRNVEFKTEVSADNTTDYNVDCKIGSQHTNGALWSEAVRGNAGILKKMTRTYNVTTGNYSFPEQHITNNIANQYSTPTISLQMTVHNRLTPYSCITWQRMAGKKFMPDTIQINYEYETQDIGITEIKTPSALTTTRRNTTRNYRRNHDLIFNGDRVTNSNPVTLTNPQVLIVGTFTENNGYLEYSGLETEVGNITLQSNFNTCNMQLSIPNDMTDEIQFEVENGALVVTTN